MNALIRRQDFVSELCLALAHRLEPERQFLILTAYLDESGTHGDSPVTVMAGALGTVRQWSRFQKIFDRLKRDHQFETFHSKEFVQRTGRFSGWSPERCIALLKDLAISTEGTFTDGVVMIFENAAYEEEYRNGDKPRRLILDSKYGLCFRQCLYYFMLQA